MGDKRVRRGRQEGEEGETRGGQEGEKRRGREGKKGRWVK